MVIKQGPVIIKVIVAYFLPRKWNASQPDQAILVQGNKLLMDWVRDEVCATPYRVTPFILTDLNDGLGKRGKELCLDRAVGKFAIRSEGETGRAWRRGSAAAGGELVGG